MNEISSRSDDSFVVGAGSRLKDICRLSASVNLQVLNFEGIPDIGSIKNECGCYGGEIYDLVEWVSFLYPMVP